MTPKLINELLQKLERFRTEVSELIYAGVPVHLINRIPNISRSAVEEIAYQIECKEEELFGIKKEQEELTHDKVATLLKAGVPLSIIRRRYNKCSKEQFHELAKPTRKLLYQSFLTSSDMRKRKDIISNRTKDYVYLYVQIGGLEQVFSDTFRRETDRDLLNYIREVNDILPSNNTSFFKDLTFPYKPKPFTHDRETLPLGNFGLQGNYIEGLKIRQRIEKLSLMSAIHGIEVLARETLLSEELVGYLLNARLQSVLEKDLGIVLPTRGIIKNHPEIYNNIYGFVTETDAMLTNEAYLCYHREHNRYFAYLSKREFKRVLNLNIPFDMMVYLTGLAELNVAQVYYSDINCEREYSWVIPYNSRLIESQSDEVSSYIYNSTSLPPNHELTNLVRQVQFSLSHLRVGKVFLDLMFKAANNPSGLYWMLYSHCLACGISLNTAFTYVAPVYIRKSLVTA